MGIRPGILLTLLVSLLALCILGCTGIHQASPLPGEATGSDAASDPYLGLPALPVPEDNPMTKDKIALGDKLFHDERFSTDGKVSCATCHDRKKAFTDGPLKVSEGIEKLTGTRNAPTVLNSAFNLTQFWDGRSPSLEDQALHPFTNPVEMGLKDHEPILAIVRADETYKEAFKKVFNMSPDKVTIKEVTKAIAAFERTVISGNSRFDRWYFNGEDTLSKKEQQGFKVFIENGRCVSCHSVEHTSALFTDHKFHNVGVGINRVPKADVDRLVGEFMSANYKQEEVDVMVLKDAKTSEIGRVAVSRNLTEIGAFKTPTLRNIELTAPYMHDGSLKTLEEVVDHYDLGGASPDLGDEEITPFLSGGIRPLELSDEEKANLVAFLKTLTSSEVAAAMKAGE